MAIKPRKALRPKAVANEAANEAADEAAGKTADEPAGEAISQPVSKKNMALPPFSVIEKLVIGKSSHAAMIRFLLSETIRQGEFDEQAYLESNPKVAAAIAAGRWPDGRSHFADVGYFEGLPSPAYQFSESWYLDKYPDVRAGIDNKAWKSGAEHYFKIGAFEARNPSEAAAADIKNWKQVIVPAPAKRAAGAPEMNRIVEQAWKNRWKREGMEYVSVVLPVGTLAPKGDLLWGRNGNAFLVDTPGSPLDWYGKPESEVAAAAKTVFELFQRREAVMRKRRIKLLQMIVPEKISVLPEAFPVKLQVPTTLLSAVEKKCLSDPLVKKTFLSCHKLFNRNDTRRQDIFRPIDTHLAPYGAFVLVQKILQRLGLPKLPEIKFDQPRLSQTDVSSRFFGVVETYMECETGWAAACEKLSESRATLGHIGKRQSWSCPAAPQQLKLLAFGNSYVNFAELGQYTVAWWLARVFAEFEFVWAPRLDMDMVDDLKPDIVLCQTVERDLQRMPRN